MMKEGLKISETRTRHFSLYTSRRVEFRRSILDFDSFWMEYDNFFLLSEKYYLDGRQKPPKRL